MKCTTQARRTKRMAVQGDHQYEFAPFSPKGLPVWKADFKNEAPEKAAYSFAEIPTTIKVSQKQVYGRSQEHMKPDTPQL
jgi:hypothetical protein